MQPLRIVGGWRAGFFVGFIALLVAYSYFLDNPLSGPIIDPVLAELGSFLIVVCFWVCAARLFRGPDEPVAPPRPWWQMTYGFHASWLLGALTGVGFRPFLRSGGASGHRDSSRMCVM